MRGGKRALEGRVVPVGWARDGAGPEQRRRVGQESPAGKAWATAWRPDPTGHPRACERIFWGIFGGCF